MKTAARFALLVAVGLAFAGLPVVAAAAPSGSDDASDTWEGLPRCAGEPAAEPEAWGGGGGGFGPDWRDSSAPNHEETIEPAPTKCQLQCNKKWRDLPPAEDPNHPGEDLLGDVRNDAAPLSRKCKEDEPSECVLAEDAVVGECTFAHDDCRTPRSITKYSEGMFMHRPPCRLELTSATSCRRCWAWNRFRRPESTEKKRKVCNPGGTEELSFRTREKQGDEGRDGWWWEDRCFPLEGGLSCSGSCNLHFQNSETECAETVFHVHCRTVPRTLLTPLDLGFRMPIPSSTFQPVASTNLGVGTCEAQYMYLSGGTVHEEAVQFYNASQDFSARRLMFECNKAADIEAYYSSLSLETDPNAAGGTVFPPTASPTATPVGSVSAHPAKFVHGCRCNTGDALVVVGPNRFDYFALSPAPAPTATPTPGVPTKTPTKTPTPVAPTKTPTPTGSTFVAPTPTVQRR